MTLENINKPNPKHYKIELTNIPVIIDGKEVIVDSLQLETRYVLKKAITRPQKNDPRSWAEETPLKN